MLHGTAVLGRFRSDLSVVKRLLIRLAVAMSLFMGGVVVIGNWRSNRAPNLEDLAFGFLGFPTVALALWLVCKVLWVLYTVKVLPGALRCYDMAGIYATVPWSEITSLGRIDSHGLVYITIHVKGRLTPLTLPVWLEDMPGFIRLVESEAGSDHVLVKALKEETQ